MKTRKMKIDVKQGLTLNSMKIMIKLGTIVMSTKTVMKIRKAKTVSMGKSRQW